ncbi:DNA-binding transcriptional MerR regulator [Lipingzhangella halophila]|uniref:DNA-binding transcriptional MerR regulator n=1 Tax=Lipingzhangella halophila TaxID=1783352 RepID=A0A7W7RL43_9ACTN|nr:MerR family transcriptional regulator [Lipingzhangella halophila]MBB4933787.1 DNA-binding transcriptional MerR regulator [Lipingzhangella halophila]
MAQRALRPVDLAREHGLSTQAVRNYEDERILPPAGRSGAGYRQYSAVHAQALRTFLALRPGFGYQTAAAILRAAHLRDHETLFRLVDRTHATVLHERDTLDEVAAALDTLTSEPSQHEGPATALSIGALAHQLGMHPASLRKWEKAGILRPHRDPATGHRVYHPEAVRDARIARQLRRGGHLLPRIRLFVDQLREAGGATALRELIHQWRSRIDQRSGAMLAGARSLADYRDLLAAEQVDEE